MEIGTGYFPMPRCRRKWGLVLFGKRYRIVDMSQIRTAFSHYPALEKAMQLRCNVAPLIPTCRGSPICFCRVLFAGYRRQQHPSGAEKYFLKKQRYFCKKLLQMGKTCAIIPEYGLLPRRTLSAVTDHDHKINHNKIARSK